MLTSIDEPVGKDLAFLAGGGECGRLIAAFDWAKTPLGPIENWPQSLKTATGILLRSPVPIVMLWGEHGVMIYNDAYSEFAGGRHPQLLGCKVREGWPEVADFNDNVMKVGLSGGTLSYSDQELTLHRNGEPEQVWMNLDYSPVPGDDGEPAGVIAIVVETTQRVLADRRDATQRERFARMFEQAPGFMALLRGPDHIFELANPAYMQLVGHREILGRPVAQALPEAVDQGFTRILEEIYRTGEPFVGRNIEVDLQRTPGAPLERRVVDFVYQPITEGSSVAGIFVEGSDITERARAEELRETQNELLRDAVSNAPLPEILEKLVLAVEKRSTSGVLASILLVDEDGRHLIHGAAPNLPDAYNEAIHGITIGPAVGSCGTAAHRGEPVFVSDIASDPLWADFKELAIGHGLRACWSMPILGGDGRVLGTFAMYHKQPREPVESDLDLVEFVTRTASLIIERRQAEGALRDREERLRLVIDSASDYAIFTIDEERIVTSWSDGAANVFGYSAADAIGMCADRLWTPEDREIGQPPREVEVARTKGCSNDERWHLRADGERVFLNGSVHPLPPDSEGRDRGFIKIARDETNRRATEEALREETRTLDTLNQTWATVAGDLNLERIVQQVTDAAVELTGAQFGAFLYNVLDEAGESYMLYSLSGVPRSNFDKFPMPRNTAVFDHTFRGLGVVRSDNVLLDPRYGKSPPHYGLPKGHLPVVSYLAVPVISRSGEVLGGLFFGHEETAKFTERHERLIVAIAAQAAIAIDNARLYSDAQREIEERRSAEARLAEVSRRLDAVLNNTMMAVFVMDECHHCIFANSAAEKLTGYSFEEMRGRPFHDLVHSTRPDGSDYPAAECPINEAFESSTRTEGEEWFRTRNGTFVPIAFTASPIHDEASKTVGTILEVRDISEQRARAAELAEALQAKEMLLHEVNHRVKNSLQVVTSLLMLQAGRAKEPALKQALLEARGRIGVVAGIHQRLYSTSQHDRVDFGNYLQELATETLRSLNSSGKIALDIDIGKDVVMPLTQAVPLALAVSELITNAVKYAFPGERSGKLTVELRDEGERVDICVADNGIGLPEGFDPSAGGGLGMRIVTALVRQVRGTLAVRSAEPGAEFVISVPLTTSV